MREGTIKVSKTFPMKEGDKLIFRDRHKKVTSVHLVTALYDGNGTQTAYTSIRDCSR